MAYMKEHTSTLKTTISPARIGSLLMCKNSISPCKTNIWLHSYSQTYLLILKELFLGYTEHFVEDNQTFAKTYKFKTKSLSRP